MTPSSSSAWVARRDTQVPDDVARVLASLPEWFGLPEANADYIDAARTMETWTVRDEADVVLGVALVDWHFPHVAEFHLMAVSREQRGMGIGRSLVRAIEDDARRRGATLFEVKTLGASHPDAGYAQTRHFYERCGFLPLEETDLWGVENPCLILVKPLVTL